jgi:hypothetical protein
MPGDGRSVDGQAACPFDESEFDKRQLNFCCRGVYNDFVGGRMGFPQPRRALSHRSDTTIGATNEAEVRRSSRFVTIRSPLLRCAGAADAHRVDTIALDLSCLALI